MTVDRSSLSQGWTVREDAANCALTSNLDGHEACLTSYITTSYITAPDGTAVKSYRLHSTPFLDTSMTVTGTAASDGKAVIPRAAFDGLSASDLAVTGAPKLDGMTTEPSVTDNADGMKTARILFIRNDVIVWSLKTVVSAEAPKYSADDLKGLTFTVGGKPWDGNDLADPSALEWSGLPDGWTVADSTKDGIRTLAFTAPDGTVVRAVRVGSLHDADKPKTDKAADRTADSASAATASKPLVSTGVAIAGAAVGIVLLAAIGIALAMASRRK